MVVAIVPEEGLIPAPANAKGRNSDQMTIRVRIANARLKRIAAVVGIIALGACTLSTENPQSLILGILDGNSQSGAAGMALPDPLRVIVVDQFGSSTAGVTVGWAIASGGGSLSAASTITDANGVSAITYTAGPTPGDARITATVIGIGTVSFAETIT